jgi:16S rRNA (guanine1516-N2)-methyltransferase
LHPDFELKREAGKLQLYKKDSRDGAICVDFSVGKSAHRLKYGGGKGQLIAKAVGLKKGGPSTSIQPTIIDLTAGLGADAFVLASLGCHVTMVERSEIIAALLKDGLERAECEQTVSEIAKRMSLQQMDGVAYLSHLNTPPDICYLDPMYPHTKKSALPTKEMRLLRELLFDNATPATLSTDIDLLNAALKVAKKRVIVKRPRKAKFISDREPDFQITGKSTRYDIYLPKSPKSKP